MSTTDDSVFSLIIKIYEWKFGKGSFSETVISKVTDLMKTDLDLFQRIFNDERIERISVPGFDDELKNSRGVFIYYRDNDGNSEIIIQAIKENLKLNYNSNLRSFIYDYLRTLHNDREYLKKYDFTKEAYQLSGRYVSELNQEVVKKILNSRTSKAELHLSKERIFANTTRGTIEVYKIKDLDSLVVEFAELYFDMHLSALDLVRMERSFDEETYDSIYKKLNENKELISFNSFCRWLYQRRYGSISKLRETADKHKTILAEKAHTFKKSLKEKNSEIRSLEYNVMKLSKAVEAKESVIRRFSSTIKTQTSEIEEKDLRIEELEERYKFEILKTGVMAKRILELEAENESLKLQAGEAEKLNIDLVSKMKSFFQLKAEFTE